MMLKVMCVDVAARFPVPRQTGTGCPDRSSHRCDLSVRFAYDVCRFALMLLLAKQAPPIDENDNEATSALSVSLPTSSSNPRLSPPFAVRHPRARAA